MSRHQIVVLLALLISLTPTRLLGQSSGSRGGSEQRANGDDILPLLDREIAERYITIEGSAEVRVEPTEIRVVLAATSEGKTAQDCQQQIQNTVNDLKAAWLKLGVPAESMVVDFIAVLPRYEWSLEQRGDNEVGIEQKVGHRMQTNVHLAVQKESTAQAAISKALELGITDIIAFDYWSRELDDHKVRARELAVQATRRKAKFLLGELLETQPPVINVQERTRVHYPASLYHSFVNSYEESVTPAWKQSTPFVRAYRPRNTYYRGLYTDGDIQGRKLPMNPEISVVSTVRLYFQSPGAKRAQQDDANEK